MKYLLICLSFISTSNFAMALNETTPANDALIRQVHLKFIDDFILEKLTIFRVEAINLDKEAKQLCLKDGFADISAIKTQFKQTVKAWMPLQSTRFDAFEKHNRALRIYFWPNSRGEKQAKKLLLNMDMSKLDPNYFDGISVAVQGLPIIEWLLYHKDSTINSDNQKLKNYTCAFLNAISLNIINVSNELMNEFSTGGKARQKLLNLNTNNPDYSSLAEVTLQFYKSIHAMVELVHGQKLSRPIGKEIKHLRPKRLEMWRSIGTKEYLIANIKGIFQAYEIISPLVKVGVDGEAIDKETKDEFRQAIALLKALPDDVYASLTEDKRAENWQKARQLITKLDRLKYNLAIKVTDALGIPLGFNALDGD